MTLVHSALAPPEPKVSGSKQDFVGWSFKSAPVPPADYHLSLVDRTPLIFRCYVGAPSWLWCFGLGAQLRVETPLFAREPCS